MQDRYDRKLAAAYVRGMARKGILTIDDSLLHAPLEHLTQEEQERLMDAGKAAGLKMYRFKNHEELARVKSVLGLLRGIQPESLLEIKVAC